MHASEYQWFTDGLRIRPVIKICWSLIRWKIISHSHHRRMQTAYASIYFHNLAWAKSIAVPLAVIVNGAKHILSALKHRRLQKNTAFRCVSWQLYCVQFFFAMHCSTTSSITALMKWRAILLLQCTFFADLEKERESKFVFFQRQLLFGLSKRIEQWNNIFNIFNKRVLSLRNHLFYEFEHSCTSFGLC